MRFESRKTSLTILLLPFLLSFLSPIVSSSYNQAAEEGLAPWEIWDQDGEGKYIDCEFDENDNAQCDYVFPWGGDEMMQFKEYYTFETIRDRMMRIAADNPDFIQYHEGLNGGVNARGEDTTADTYKGWEYRNPSPWLKITGDVEGGEYNDFNGDTGNYADRPDVMIVGNHHAREWMSHTTPMLYLETIAYYYGGGPVDNDGDGQFDEDPFGDADGDGHVDDDGDCLALEAQYQDSNGDGKPCNPGDFGVDEDFSEVELTNDINNREIYLIPLLNTDGFIYDQTVFCPAPAWESCPSGGWRKNLRNNGPEPLPDANEQVDEDCDGVDLNRNYQFEWGWPLGATVPLIPGTCTPAEDERAGISNNDVYTGPYDTTDNDGDGLINEDNVDGEDDDNDGKLDEDWAGGNSEPETKFIQDMTEMNDDDGDGASDYKATLTYHSYSELVLYPWGHCTGCETVDHDQLVYHGDQMAEMTDYTNMQSSDLYPTTGDFCDWHYGVHGSYCYTMEIGTAFHQHEDDIDHIAVRNNGIAFYMTKIADNPKERADLAMSNVVRNQILIEPDGVNIPASGGVPIEMCLDSSFSIDLEMKNSHVMYRMVKPSRQQSDYGPQEWFTESWSMAPFSVDKGATCELLNESGQGYVVAANLPIQDDETGFLHYKSMISTLGGTQKIEYPQNEPYYEIKIDYRAPYGNIYGSVMLFITIAVFVWGGLGVCLRMMMDDDSMKDAILDAEFVEEASS
ncbi:MAG: M14 family zinc carboxypeptidase [Candidatus Poseidoniaceae archaeon]|nr:M14 family zinc carboxypeptidase [Candidatus Poseidoniaceae archaeon]